MSLGQDTKISIILYKIDIMTRSQRKAISDELRQLDRVVIGQHRWRLGSPPSSGPRFELLQHGRLDPLSSDRIPGALEQPHIEIGPSEFHRVRSNEELLNAELRPRGQECVQDRVLLEHIQVSLWLVEEDRRSIDRRDRRKHSEHGLGAAPQIIEREDASIGDPAKVTA